MTSPTDLLAERLRRVADGDRRAFAAVYAATSAKLYGIVLRIVRERARADDVLQDVYVRIWERAGDFEAARASPITWMATIARNRALDEVRRRRPASLDELPEALEIAAEQADPLAGREASEAMARLQRCLDGLEAPRREIVLLAYCHGLSREALASRFGHPVATIKTWLHRSLAQVRGCLET
jgi:RNA polymerase sigma-70 factor (ECF subfamily)